VSPDIARKMPLLVITDAYLGVDDCRDGQWLLLQIEYCEFAFTEF